MSWVARALTRPPVLRAVTWVLTPVGPLRKLFFALMRFQSEVAIVYVSRDDPELIAVAYGYYRRLGITIRVFLDGESSERTDAYLEERGISFTRVRRPEAGDAVGPILGPVAAMTDTEWFLRMDNDELLNLHSLVELSILARFDNENDCFGIRRSWVLEQEGAMHVGDSDFLGDDYQWRLVRHRRVTFHGRVHTPGFDVPPGRNAVLTPASRLYHFDWVVRSLAYRQRKVDFYEDQLPGTRELLVRYYLPEECMEDLKLTPIEEPAAESAVSEYGGLAPRYRELVDRAA
jgi:hypothetical protein